MKLYWNWRDFGDPWGQGWMAWPPGLLNMIRVVGNVYRALSGYRDATNKVEWTQKNPKAWEIVGEVRLLQAERDQVQVLSPYERWLGWQKSDGEQNG